MALDIKKLSVTELQTAIESGSRVLIFPYCISVGIMSFRRHSGPRLVGERESAFAASLPWLAITLIAGWWGIPWGIFWSLESVFFCVTGGRDITNEFVTQDDAVERDSFHRGKESDIIDPISNQVLDSQKNLLNRAKTTDDGQRLELQRENRRDELAELIAEIWTGPDSSGKQCEITASKVHIDMASPPFDTLDLSQLITRFIEQDAESIHRASNFIIIGTPNDTCLSLLVRRVAVLRRSFSEQECDRLIRKGVVGCIDEIRPVKLAPAFVAKYVIAVCKGSDDPCFDVIGPEKSKSQTVLQNREAM